MEKWVLIFGKIFTGKGKGLLRRNYGKLGDETCLTLKI